LSHKQNPELTTEFIPVEEFLNGAKKFGLPQKVRIDQGGENYGIIFLMNLLKDKGDKACLVGTSVFNQRIERLWRDVT
jgi:hypothetical protein